MSDKTISIADLHAFVAQILTKAGPSAPHGPHHRGGRA